jgi:phosphoglycerate dehydrogenase-like enzyme
MERLRVAVLDDYQHAARRFADWQALSAEVVFLHDAFADSAATVEGLAAYDVVVAMRERTRFPAEVLERLPRLKLLVTTAMGNSAIDIPFARRQGVVVCGTRYPDIAATAELTWGLILAASRHIPEEVGSVRAGGWQTGVGQSLEGATLGLLGLGRLGSRVALIGQAFGMQTVAWSQNLRPEVAAECGVEPVTKQRLFESADVLSIHLVLSERTRAVVGPAELAIMKPSALLVNTSRGALVDEKALVRSLRNRSIRGAALDVFDTEPLPLDHELRSLENVMATPHIGYVTEKQYDVFYKDAVEDIEAFIAGARIRTLA